MRTFYLQYNVGKAKYLVNYHDGIKKHVDGSKFFDIATFKNKQKLKLFLNRLQNNGYSEE